MFFEDSENSRSLTKQFAFLEQYNSSKDGVLLAC